MSGRGRTNIETLQSLQKKQETAVNQNIAQGNSNISNEFDAEMRQFQPTTADNRIITNSTTTSTSTASNVNNNSITNTTTNVNNNSSINDTVDLIQTNLPNNTPVMETVNINRSGELYERTQLFQEHAQRQRQINIDLPHEINPLPNGNPVVQPPVPNVAVEANNIQNNLENIGEALNGIRENAQHLQGRHEARAEIIAHTSQALRLMRNEAAHIVQELSGFMARHPTGSFLMASATMAGVGVFIFRYMAPGRFLLRILNRVMSPESISSVLTPGAIHLQQRIGNNNIPPTQQAPGNNNVSAVDAALNALGLPGVNGIINTIISIQALDYFRRRR